jgi:peptide/nickel transport system substrate-binding protein
MVRTGEAAIASVGPETMVSAARGGLQVLAVPGTMQALYQFWGSYRPEFKGSPVADPRVREALSLAIDRQQIIENVMNGKASMPYPFAAFDYTEYFNAAKWKQWSNQAYRYDPARAKALLAEAGYPNGFDLNFANTALPGTQFMVDIGTAVADMWSRIGVRVTLTNYEWGSFAPLARGDQAYLTGGVSMYRTVGRPDMPWRHEGSFASDSEQHLLGGTANCDESCQAFDSVYRELLSERDPAKRTVLTDRMVQAVAETRIAVPIIEGMGYYAINSHQVGQFAAIPGHQELGDVFERMRMPVSHALPVRHGPLLASGTGSGRSRTWA